jgi:hypothetical protein
MSKYKESYSSGETESLMMMITSYLNTFSLMTKTKGKKKILNAKRLSKI